VSNNREAMEKGASLKYLFRSSASENEPGPLFRSRNPVHGVDADESDRPRCT